MPKNPKEEYISKQDAHEMIESALRRHNRRSTIISSILGWILIGGYSFGLFHVVQSTQNLILYKKRHQMIDLDKVNQLMKHNLKNNLIEIKKYYKRRLLKAESDDIKSLSNEFKEWIDDSFNGNQIIWTLPDLTRSERLKNFCRAIKKKVI